MIPNEFMFGCMLDALVSNGEVSEAVAASLRCSNQGLQNAQTFTQVPWVPACSNGSTSAMCMGRMWSRIAP